MMRSKVIAPVKHRLSGGVDNFSGGAKKWFAFSLMRDIRASELMRMIR